MKISVPTRNNEVDAHFGHCEHFTVFTISTENRIEHEVIVPSPQGCGCKSDIAGILSKMGVSVMLAGNMGNGAVQVLHTNGIEVYRGCSGEVRQLAENFMKGMVEDNGVNCSHHSHHEEGHQCNHDH
jgi:predicted Fe-Mo cluster-binding NifX family protein